jgi:hypothetical protein
VESQRPHAGAGAQLLRLWQKITREMILLPAVGGRNPLAATNDLHDAPSGRVATAGRAENFHILLEHSYDSQRNQNVGSKDPGGLLARPAAT